MNNTCLKHSSSLSVNELSDAPMDWGWLLFAFFLLLLSQYSCPSTFQNHILRGKHSTSSFTTMGWWMKIPDLKVMESSWGYTCFGYCSELVLLLFNWVLSFSIIFAREETSHHIRLTLGARASVNQKHEHEQICRSPSMISIYGRHLCSVLMCISWCKQEVRGATILVRTW